MNNKKLLLLYKTINNEYNYQSSLMPGLRYATGYGYTHANAVTTLY